MPGLKTVEVSVVSSARDGEVAVAGEKIDMKEAVEVEGSGHRECLDVQEEKELGKSPFNGSGSPLEDCAIH